MNKLPKFIEKQNIYFASDFHLNHNKDFVFGKRGFKNIEQHNDFVIEKINDQVKENDILFNLGDFALNSSYEQVSDFLDRINCKNIFYIWGNHEGSMWSLYSREVQKKFNCPTLEVYPFEFKNVIFCGNYLRIKVDKQEVTLCHFAPKIWNKSHHGAIALCGHSHGSFSDILPNHEHGKILDVGVEVALSFYQREKVAFSWLDILEIMKNKNTMVVDHHNSSTT